MRLYTSLRSAAIALLGLLLLSTVLHAEATLSASEAERVLNRYREINGGTAAFNRIQNLRIKGEVSLPNGGAMKVTVIKRRPTSVRITFHAEERYMTHAYNGELAWTMMETPARSLIVKMQEPQRTEFIRNAPIDNIFFNPKQTEAMISITETVLAGRVECYLLIARFNDGSRQETAIDKAEFRDRRIAIYSAEGELISETFPSQFTTIEGVVFAQRMLTRKPDQPDSDFHIHEIQTNIGIFQSAFDPPVIESKP
jgi:hypothetical protein